MSQAIDAGDHQQREIHQPQRGADGFALRGQRAAVLLVDEPQQQADGEIRQQQQAAEVTGARIQQRAHALAAARAR